jgi:hypothetical protein
MHRKKEEAMHRDINWSAAAEYLTKSYFYAVIKSANPMQSCLKMVRKKKSQKVKFFKKNQLIFTLH